MTRLPAAALALVVASCANGALSHPSSPLRVRPALSVVPMPRVLVQYDASYEWDGDMRAGSVSDAGLRQRHGPEAYRLTVDAGGIHIRYGGHAGRFYALQTLAQLQRDNGLHHAIPYVRIEDWPAYRWRGIHLDVSRHYFALPVMKRLIAGAARYKLNVFHWHLTDDQAWRLQIGAYPRLAAAQSYSGADVRELVDFARQRFVTVVPEIEMTSHNTAALRAYPAAAQTAEFYRTVLREVVAAFPGKFVHAGGDEAVYTPERRALMQSLVTYLRLQHRQAIVWDDARAANLPSSVTYMVWHPSAALRRALAARDDIIVSTDGPLYFDAYQGDRAQEPRASAHMATLEQVYDEDPPAGPHVVGVQANIWTEHIASADHLLYMAFPRALALAEIAWDPPERKDWNSFLRRLPAQLRWMDFIGIPYRVPNVAISIPGARFFPRRGNATGAIARAELASVRVSLRAPLDRGRIFYTLDGGVPTARSSEYNGPFAIRIDRPVVIRAMAVSAAGRRGTVSECTVERDRTHAHSGARSWDSIISP